jgi:hypothetical protein
VSTPAWLALAAIAFVIFGTGSYRYSLERNPTRACHSCGGTGINRAWVWWYARGECRAKTLLPPRVQCDRGRIPRYGVRLFAIDGKGRG